MAVAAFFDTSVLLAGLVDFGPQSAPAQSLMHAVAERQIASVATAWHCCLEFYSVSTRLPPEYRVAPADALRLLESEVFGRLSVHDLPPADRLAMLRAAAQDGTVGGRIYDAHIANIARAAGASVMSPTTAGIFSHHCAMPSASRRRVNSSPPCRLVDAEPHCTAGLRPAKAGHYVRFKCAVR